MEETWLEALSGEVPVYPPPHLVFHALHYAVRVKIFLVPAPTLLLKLPLKLR